MPADGPSTFPTGNPLPGEATEAESTNLEQRVRRGTDAFAFDALLNGVSRTPQPLEPASKSTVPPAPQAPLPNHERSRVEPGPPASPPNRRWLWTILLLAALAGGAVRLLVPFVRPSSEKTPPPMVALNPLVKQGLPDPNLTPGDVGPNTGLVSPETRRAVLRSYGINQDDPQYVLNTLIPASMGGSNRAANLFPTTRWFARLKVRLDATLTARVNSGAISVVDARAQLQANWIRAAHKHNVRNYGQRDPAKAKTIEDRLAW